MRVHVLWIFLSYVYVILGQRTQLDDEFTRLIDPIKKTLVNLLGSTGGDPRMVRQSRKFGKTQNEVPMTKKFFCDTTEARSVERPTSVHRLRPGDIDVIGAMGDSLTVANGAMATNVLHVSIENRGVSWSIGGQETWRTYMTLPNIFKEFNPNLYGYSLGDSLSTDRASRFNVADLGAMSEDMPHQARNLIKRMKHDSNVNMTHDWKLVTLFIGNNDFCSNICFQPSMDEVLKRHEADLIKALRILRDNIPRLIVNVVPPPNLRIITEFIGIPEHCVYTHLLECACLFGWRARDMNVYDKLMKGWIKMDKKIVDMDEFNSEDFTVNYQPFTAELTFPTLKSSKVDMRYLSQDCFHLSQKAHARSANAYWNNILEAYDKKNHDWNKEFEVFHCPTKEKPYLMTRENSK